jgi:hypothetical protein
VVQKCPTCMEPEDSLPCSHKPAIGPYPEPAQFTLSPHIMCLGIGILLCLDLLGDVFSWDSLTEILYAFLLPRLQLNRSFRLFWFYTVTIPAKSAMYEHLHYGSFICLSVTSCSLDPNFYLITLCLHTQLPCCVGRDDESAAVRGASWNRSLRGVL